MDLPENFRCYRRCFARSPYLTGRPSSTSADVYKGGEVSTEADSVRALRSEGVDTFDFARQLGIARARVHSVLEGTA